MVKVSVKKLKYVEVKRGWQELVLMSDTVTFCEIWGPDGGVVKIQFFWDVTPFQPGVTDFSKHCNAFIFRVKQSMMSYERYGITIIRNFPSYLAVKYSILHFYIVFVPYYF